MSWTTSVADLRTLLSDGEADRYCRRKKVFGRQNGSNKTFFTFEFRRVTDFTSTEEPLTVYVNGSAAGITADDPGTGFFTLATAPANNDILEATYYYQWFTDAELTAFLTSAVRWLGLGTDPSTLDDGLVPAALQYAAKDAYYKMALRWRERASTAFMLEDAPRKEAIEAATGFEALVKSSYAMAKELRNDFYGRQGQANAPVFGVAFGSVRPVTPRR